MEGAMHSCDWDTDMIIRMQIERLNFQDNEDILQWFPFLFEAKFDSPTAAMRDIARAIQTNNRMYTKAENWDAYLPYIPSDVATPNNFTQWQSPPPNYFQIGMVVEFVAEDGTSSTVIVSEVNGPRIRLRFTPIFFGWVMCDADNIRPVSFYHPCAAPDEAFQRPPQRPPKNGFRPGDRLEAVSVRFPRRIVAAVVEKVFGDYVSIFIPFECYSFSCIHYSRNIFPVGWCKRANIELMGLGHARFIIPYILNNMSRQTYYMQLRNKFITRGTYMQLKPISLDQLETWSVDDVAEFLSLCEPIVASYAETFKMANIDGLTLLFITPITMLKKMGVKLGPALKIRILVNILAGKPWQTIADY